jgi:TRAP-type mannitol/chloroaromatic compound transport system permease large subunit
MRRELREVVIGLMTLIALWFVWLLSLLLFAFALPVGIGAALVASAFVLASAKRRLRRQADR